VIINPFQSNHSANHVLPSSYLFWVGNRLGGLLVIILQKNIEKHKEYNLRYLLAKVSTTWGKASDRLRQRANKLKNNRVGRLPTSERNRKIMLSDEVRQHDRKGLIWQAHRPRMSKVHWGTILRICCSFSYRNFSRFFVFFPLKLVFILHVCLAQVLFFSTFQVLVICPPWHFNLGARILLIFLVPMIAHLSLKNVLFFKFRTNSQSSDVLCKKDNFSLPQYFARRIISGYRSTL